MHSLKHFVYLVGLHIYYKIVSVNFSCASFSLLNFFTFEDGIDMLSWNIGKELPFYSV